MFPRLPAGAIAGAITMCATSAYPQAPSQPQRLPEVNVTVSRPVPPKRAPRQAVRRPPQPQPATQPVAAQPSTVASTPGNGVPPIVQRFQLPQQSFSITARRIEQTINLKDAEDGVKYMPSLFVRKRNDGDNQAVLATRTWGLNSSARTLIYADDLLISALIGNNNTGASPHWNLVAPQTIERIDFLNGPYAAAYPGNSIGGVLIMTTKMPDKPTLDFKETVSIMPWNDKYGTRDTYKSSVTSALGGNRQGDFSWLAAVNVVDSFQQPLTYQTNGSPPAGTTGTIIALSKQGLPADVVGTGALIHTVQTSANFKFAYDITPAIRATYSLGLWNNHETSTPQSYLTTLAGAPTYGNVAGFATNEFIWDQTHLSNVVSLRSDSRDAFDFDLSASSYNYIQDTQLNPFTVAQNNTLGFTQNGRITRNDGTNWQLGDAKGIWRPFGYNGPHEISFGLHGDRFELNNPVYASANWNTTSSIGTGQFYSVGAGQTQTGAIWAQDAWKITPFLKLTLGGRLETWHAFDGFNLNTIANSATGVITSTNAVNQPALSSTNFSPKASVSYDINKDWNVTANFGEAWRYPTVTELYQNITVGGVATFANPFLAPEHDLNGEINFERRWADGRARATFFYEHVDNAIISQTNLATNPSNGAQVPTTTIGNVAAIQMRGIELSADKDNVFIRGLQLFGSVTYVDSTILSDPTFVNSTTGLPQNVTGNRVPNVPDWRVKFGYTYRPNDQWAWTVAARYFGKQYSTLDNTDIVSHVQGAFDTFFVVDTKVHYEATNHLSFDFGIDNIFNEQYFLFHPFPGRTFITAARYKF
jgi:iron complex outermembrane receptor protein